MLIQNTTDQNISQLNDKFDKFSLTKRQDSGIAGSPMSGDSQLDLEEMDAKVGDLTISENSNNSLQLVDLRQNSQSNSDSGHENDAADQMLTINKKITKSSKNDEDTSEKSSTANSNNNNTTPLPVPQGLRLETPWTLFVDKIPDSGASLEDYQENLRNIYTVQSVETFWQVFNNIPAPSCLSCRYSYHLMRGDGTRQPTWEDPLNANGGHWKLKCHKQYTNLVWQELLLAAVGEQFSTSTRYDDMVTGVSVSIREKDDHFQIWNANADRHHEAAVIERVRNLLPRIKFHTIFYKEHKSHGTGADGGASKKKRKNRRNR